MKRKQIEHHFGDTVENVIAFMRKNYWRLGCSIAALYALYTLHVAVDTFLVVSRRFMAFTEFFFNWAIGGSLS